MTALAPSGVGLPAPDCLVHSSSGASHRLSELAASSGWLLLVPTLFSNEDALVRLATAAGNITIICGDSPQALAQAKLADELRIYCDPSLLFARLYGISSAPAGCHYGLFQLQDGWLRMSFISECADSARWQALIAA